jgi:ribonuclease R
VSPGPGPARREREPSRAEAVVAVLEKRGRRLVATPFFERGRRMTVAPERGVRAGDLVLLRPAERGGGARIARRVGRPDVAADVIEALMLDRGLRRSFPPAVERAAAEARPPEAARRDLRHLTTFTVDPASARDFDDALSAEDLGSGRRRVWVHIADVSAYVRPATPVEREAYRRATSVYVPGSVEPMLPHALSSDLCSLRPGEDRLAVTVETDLRGARVERTVFHPPSFAPTLAWTTTAWTAPSPASSRPRSPGRRRWPWPAPSRPSWPRSGPGAARWRSRPWSPSSRSTPTATSPTCGARSRPSPTG